MLTPLLIDMEKEQKTLQENVFAFPPKDWAEFQARLGQWRGLDTAVERIKEFLKDEETKELKL